MPLTTLILARNNAKTIEKSVKSALSVGSVVVGDLESTDDTVAVSRMAGAKIVPLKFEYDFAGAKNALSETIKSDWILWMEPWEVIASFMDIPAKPAVFRARVIRDNVVTKEVRLWHSSRGIRWAYPAYETILDTGEHSTLILCGAGSRIENAGIVDNWTAKEPLNPVARYYRGCSMLEQRRYDEFVKDANAYLLSEKSGNSVVMTRYYLASILLRRMDTENAVKTILTCIAVNPLMAEFWCLLGDIYFRLSQWEKAACFYDNAVTLGSRRLQTDGWPIELEKYGDHPKKMIDVCLEFIKNKKLFVSTQHKDVLSC